MYYLFTVPRETFDETSIDRLKILQLIGKHQNMMVPKLDRNIGYYLGEHAIKKRTKKYTDQANNKVMVNHAKDITDTATGYFLANPITYRSSDNDIDITKLTDAFNRAELDEVDHDNAFDMSRSGIAYEYVYVKEGSNELCSRNLSPQSTFKVYDETIEQNELFSVYYSVEKDDATDRFNVIATVTTENYVTRIGIITNSEFKHGEFRDLGVPYEHHLGEDPIIEYKNNKDCIGDYEQQISLIDAYNTLTSDRINDKEQFLEAVLAIYGAVLGDDAEETVSAVKDIRRTGVLELPDAAKAEYISRTFDESGVEILKKALKEDIYSMSHVPNLTDENFAGNSSGVAMEYKLLGLEMITKTKERYYKKGLKKRMRLFCNYLNLKTLRLDPSIVVPVFSRGLPKNLLELSQMISNLKGTVSTKTLLAQLDFVQNVDDEIEMVNEEAEENAKRQQEMFGGFKNEPLEEDENEDEEDDSRGASADREGSQLDS